MKKILSLACLFMAHLCMAASADRPNILWISCEDLSPRIGAYGDPIAETPNIDRLAQEGMRFAGAYTTAGVCAPSRSAIITGMYQTSIGTQHMRTSAQIDGLPTPYSPVPPPYVKTFTEYLRAAGYYCTNNSKEDYQFETPVTAWDESSHTAHFRNRPDKDQPFFAVFNLNHTHEGQIWGEPKHTDPAKVVVPPFYPDVMPIRRHIATLYDQIAAMDATAGMILQQLEEDGLADNTVVFFWSDHGDSLPRCKNWLYETSTHVPLIVRWPERIKPGSVNEDLLSLVDLGPTVLSLASVPVPVHMQGTPFLGAQKGKPRECIFGAKDRTGIVHDMVRMVRNKQYRYIRNYYPEKPYVGWIPYRNKNNTMRTLMRMHAQGELVGPQLLWWSNQRPPEELYLVEDDPYEINNLANDPRYSHTLEELRGVLDEWRTETRDLGDISEADMVEKSWPGRVQPETCQPLFIVNAEDSFEAESTLGGVYQGPAMLRMSCSTQGASIAYTTDTGDSPRWLLYTGPFHIDGAVTVRAKAIRYGYKESPEVSASFSIQE